MPVYNGQNYLDSSIKSILNQTFDKFKLVLIDDGSTDNSQLICQQYCDIDSRVLYYKQENKGISGARNTGMTFAKGDYITFCDQDDFWDPNLLEKVYETILKESVKTVKFSIKYIVSNSKCNKMIKKYKYSKSTLITRDDIIKKYYKLKNRGYFTFVWNTVFSNEIIKEYDIKFDENLKYGGEDNVFNYSYLKNSGNTFILKEEYYTHYRRKNISQSTKTHPNKISSNLLFYLVETNYLDENRIKDSPKRVANYLLGYVNNIYDISNGKVEFKKNYQNNIEKICPVINRFVSFFSLLKLWKHPYKQLITYLILKGKSTSLFYILKLKKKMRR